VFSTVLIAVVVVVVIVVTAAVVVVVVIVVTAAVVVVVIVAVAQKRFSTSPCVALYNVSIIRLTWSSFNRGRNISTEAVLVIINHASSILSNGVIFIRTVTSHRINVPNNRLTLIQRHDQ